MIIGFAIFVKAFKIKNTKLDVDDLLASTKKVLYLKRKEIAYTNFKSSLETFLNNTEYFEEDQTLIANTTNDFMSYMHKKSENVNIKAGILLSKQSEQNFEISVAYSSSTDFKISLLEASTRAFILCNSNDSQLSKEFVVVKFVESFTQSKIKFELIIIITSIFLVILSYVNFSGFIIKISVREKETKLRHLLYISGYSSFEYWMSSFIVDFSKFLLLTMINFLILCFILDEIKHMIIIMTTSIVAVILSIYLFSYLFATNQSAQKFFMITSYSAILFLVGTYIMFFFKDMTYSGITINITSIFPISTLLYFLLKLQVPSIDKTINDPNFKFKTTLNFIIIILIQLIVIVFLILVIESRCFCKKSSKGKLNDLSNKFSIIISNLTKFYSKCCSKKKLIVKNINITLEPNIKLGILGLNGCGKTTILKALTNEIDIDNGNISVFGNDLSTNFNKIKNFIGYCPQQNAFLDSMTVEENVKFFYLVKISNIRNSLSKDNNESTINSILESFGLYNYKNTVAANLSGGNKRKLNFAIAMMNNKSLILLDEPSAGVDPQSRRMIWNHISKIKNENYNVILSTQSIEEAELLCDKISWIKSGTILFEGHPEKLKLKLSTGYCVEFKISNINQYPNCNSFENIKLEKIIGIFLLNDKKLNNDYSKNSDNNSNNDTIIENHLVKTNNFNNIEYSLLCLLQDLDNVIIEIKLLEVQTNKVKIKINFDDKYMSKVFSYLLNLKVSITFLLFLV